MFPGTFGRTADPDPRYTYPKFSKIEAFERKMEYPNNISSISTISELYDNNLSKLYKEVINGVQGKSYNDLT